MTDHDPPAPDGADQDHIGWYRYVRRDVETDHDRNLLGIRAADAPKLTLKARGFGELKTAAGDDILECVDVRDLEPGTLIADVLLDVEQWDYEIDWLIEDIAAASAMRNLFNRLIPDGGSLSEEEVVHPALEEVSEGDAVRLFVDRETGGTDRVRGELQRFRSRPDDEPRYCSAVVVTEDNRIWDLYAQIHPANGQWSKLEAGRRVYSDVHSDTQREGVVETIEAIDVGVSARELLPGVTVEHWNGDRYRVVVSPDEREYDDKVLAYNLDSSSNVCERLDPDEFLRYVGNEDGERPTTAPDGGDRFVVPYVCPECDHDRWVSADGEPGGQAVKCPECGYEDELKGPGTRTDGGTTDGAFVVLCRRGDCDFRSEESTHDAAVEAGLDHDQATGHGSDTVVSSIRATLSETDVDEADLVPDGGRSRTQIADRVAGEAVDGLERTLQQYCRDRDSVSDEDINEIVGMLRHDIENTVNQQLRRLESQHYDHDVATDGGAVVEGDSPTPRERVDGADGHLDAALAHLRAARDIQRDRPHRAGAETHQATIYRVAYEIHQTTTSLRALDQNPLTTWQDNAVAEFVDDTIVQVEAILDDPDAGLDTEAVYHLRSALQYLVALTRCPRCGKPIAGEILVESTGTGGPHALRGSTCVSQHSETGLWAIYVHDGRWSA